MKLRDRAVYAMVNLERGTGPTLTWVVNAILPRAMHTALGDGFELIEDLTYQVVAGRAMRLDVVRPRGEGPFPVVVGFHGGAWIVGRKENIRHVGTYLARRGIMAVLVEYRLAPGHCWPACAEDVAAAMRWVKANASRYGGHGERIGLFGDSAGGHLSAYGAIRIAGDPERPDDLPEVGAAVHWYGVFDMAKFSRVPWRRTEQILKALFGDARCRDAALWAEASPRAHLDAAATLPPTLVFAARHDPLYSQSLAYARELVRRGCEVELRRYERAPHGFLNLPFSPECRASLKHAARWFARHLAVDGNAGALEAARRDELLRRPRPRRGSRRSCR